MAGWLLRLSAAVLLSALGATQQISAADLASVEIGRRIYQDGVLSSGGALRGERAGGTLSTQGPDAACVNCHQHSGLGMKEGPIAIPPIAGAYLFERTRQVDQGLLPYVETMHGNRRPYTETTLAEAIRSGNDADGRTLSELMPRFDLDAADMAALIAYLRKLTVSPSPGVIDGTVHFATIFTADVDPMKRQGVLDVLEHYFAEKNSFPLAPSPRMVTSGKTAYSKSMYMANRRWRLHVWDLTGPADTWQAQLDRHLAAEPVFAVLSGAGRGNWAPVHRFCEAHGVPCLFPNVEVPVVAEHDFYNLYFSKGVLLEAELIAQAITERAAAAKGSGGTLRIEQIFRKGDSGEAGATALAA
ncbi:MAG: c-type cytochrome, partial [Sinobacteraceae bacterium]|nr:c-type cytochrome [Nevskiaceae bacterium]